MLLDDEGCYRALAARDRRFDGLFFTGVTSTGVYCRPVCPARTPRRDRCRFYPSAAAAERAGFRPCLRCRPELAPGHAPVDAGRRTARLAAARIEAGEVDDRDGGLESLAGSLGLSGRQLRRVVRQELGVSPVELAQTHRLLLAKQLLTETALPVTEVAFAAGFASLRRFNALFRQHYRLTPTALRRCAGAERAEPGVRLRLSYRPPLAWDPLLGFLLQRCTPGVECVARGVYRRTVRVGSGKGWIQVGPGEAPDSLSVELAPELTRSLPAVLARVRSLFDLDARPDVIDAHLAGDPIVGPLVKRTPGLRVPGAFDGFELAVRAILGQRITVRAATTLAGRIAAHLGEEIPTGLPGLERLFPTAEAVARVEPAGLRPLGVGAAQAGALVGLARAVVSGRLSLDPGADPERTAARLQEIPGVGEWTAQVVVMRALRWPDALPPGDRGLTTGLRGADVGVACGAWRPFRAYAAMHIWNRPGHDGDPGATRRRAR